MIEHPDLAAAYYTPQMVPHYTKICGMCQDFVPSTELITTRYCMAPLARHFGSDHHKPPAHLSIYEADSTVMHSPTSTIRAELPSDEYAIRQAHRRDIGYLASIELSAANLFRQIPALAWIAEAGNTLPLSKLSSACKAGTLWVATYDAVPVAYDTPIAFLCARPLDECLFVDEVSVSSQHQCKGLGKLLLKTAEMHAKNHGLKRLSLSTDREAPWNGPFYSRLGLREISGEFVGPGHLAISEKEEDEGLDMDRRCIMVKNLDRGDLQHDD